MKTIDLRQKLKIAMKKLNTTQTALAQRSGQTQKNLSNKFTRNDFKFSEYNKLVSALGCTLEITIILPDGERL